MCVLYRAKLCCGVVCCVLLQLPSPVSSMALNKQGSSLLLNCLDKVIRLADVAARPAKAKPVSRDAAEEALRTAPVSNKYAGRACMFAVFLCLLSTLRAGMVIIDRSLHWLQSRGADLSGCG